MGQVTVTLALYTKEKKWYLFGANIDLGLIIDTEVNRLKTRLTIINNIAFSSFVIRASFSPNDGTTGETATATGIHLVMKLGWVSILKRQISGKRD